MTKSNADRIEEAKKAFAEGRFGDMNGVVYSAYRNPQFRIKGSKEDKKISEERGIADHLLAPIAHNVPAPDHTAGNPNSEVGASDAAAATTTAHKEKLRTILSGES